jgi:hypothetical protein
MKIVRTGYSMIGSAARSVARVLVLLLVAALTVTLTSVPAEAALIATHRISPGATIGDSLKCRITLISYFGGGSPTSIWYSRIELRNYSGETTLFGGVIQEENGGKRVGIPAFSTGPSPSTKNIPVGQLFRYSRNAGFTLTLNSTSYGCGGRSETIRFLSY